MTENPAGNELVKKTSDVANNEEEGSQLTEEKGQEGLTVVKSKIRENKPVQPGGEEESGIGPLKGPMISSTKLSKYGKYKRGKGKSGERSDSDVSLDTEKKAESDVVEQSDNLPFEEKVETDEMYSKSKKSLAQKLVAKSSKKYLREDEDAAAVPSKPPEVKTNLTEDTQSTFLISHDAEAQRDGNAASALPVDLNAPIRPAASQISVHERGNYMNNVSPAPIDEYPVKDYSKKTENK